MRKQLERNKQLQFCDCQEIDLYAEKLVSDYLEKFNTVDANDLYLILIKKAGFLCTVANLKDNSNDD